MTAVAPFIPGLSLSVPLNPEFPLAKDSLYAFSGWLQGTEYIFEDQLLYAH